MLPYLQVVGDNGACCFDVFLNLLVEDLSMLTLTSKALRDIVQMYLSTESAHRGIMRLAVTHSIEPDFLQWTHYLRQFQNYGLLF